ncbi:MAG: efflux RND transporter permease subunit, partial [Verrucomicrobiae bacterium]|nr:efflux RND transporter permease subunit [Verrucomicrobiae bacterium]
LLTAVVVLERCGITINTITLGGLAIALGEVVDDSIIDVENILRRLRENRKLSVPRPAFAVVLDASLEVRRAVVFATFIVTLVFLPVLTLTGLQGSFFAPLALSYILAILASLLVALTVTPALTFLLFRRGVRGDGEPRLQHWLKRAYAGVLGLVMRRPRVLIAVVIVVCAGAFTRVPFLGGEFLPDFREGHFVLQVSTAPGTSLKEMVRLGQRLSAALLADSNHIATVEQQIGRAELGEDPWGPHRSEFHVDLKPMPVVEAEGMADEIRGILGQFPGIQFEVVTFLGDRIGETLTGETAPVVVNLFGDDLEVLDRKAQEVARLLEAVPGAADVVVKSPPGVPRMAVRLRPERLTQFGFRPVEVMEAIETAYQGTVVAQTHEGNQVTDVVVILDEAARETPEGIGDLMLSSPDGVRLPLRELAEIAPGSGRHSILHEGARRRQTITCSTSGRDVASFVADAKSRVAAGITFPANTYAVFSGAAEASARAQRELLLHSAIAGVGILLLLTVVFHHPRNLFLVLANVPFALMGGVLAVWVTRGGEADGASLTLGSLVGFVTLFGITMRNSIMMISHFEHLLTAEGLTWGPGTA